MLRHSNLNKLDKCPCYESAGGTSPAASRGTIIDGITRRMIAGELEAWKELTDAKDQQAAINGYNLIIGLIPEGTELETRESELWVKTPGMEHIGTEDCRAVKIRSSYDWKTGQTYDYEPQMAAYALGNMTRFYEPEWTCYIIYTDQNRVEQFHFTMDSATEIVERIIRSYNDPEKQPTSCQYCNWCAKKSVCSQVVKPTEQTLRVVNKEVSLDTLKTQLADPEKLGKFLKACNIFKSSLWDWAKDEAKERLLRGEDVPGWRLSKVKGKEEYGPEVVSSVAQSSGATYLDLCKLYGNVGAKDFREWATTREYDLSSETVIVGNEVVKLIEAKKK